jgi:site-specific recombinase XerD
MATSTYSASGRPQAAPEAKLGAHHLAYLRAMAEGVSQRHAAASYLGHDLHDGAVALRRSHNAIVDRVRTLARRQGDPRWRLIGIVVKPHEVGQPTPPIDQWAEELGLDGFGQAELLSLYTEAFPPDRKAQRNGRLRLQQLELLQALATVVTEPALPHHRLDAWFPAHLCRSLMDNGLLLVSDLQTLVRSGGRWWRSIPRIGVGKADRLSQHLELLVPGSTATQRHAPLARRGQQLANAIAQGPAAAAAAPQQRRVSLHLPAAPRGPTGVVDEATNASADTPQRTGSLGFVLAPEQLAARDLPADTLAVRAWIRARAGSEATAKAYRRELGRFLLFLDQRGLTLSRCNADDCLAYMALLQNVPPEWSAKRTAPLGHADWSPFAGPLSHRSQRQAVVVVGSCFGWLVAARYLPGNPWVLVNRRSGDDRQTNELASRAIPPAHWAVILARLEVLASAEPAAERMVFLLQFLEATGLRAAELLGARLGDLQRLDGRLLLQVHGKGSKNRVIPVAAQAQRALQRYLEGRGLASDAINGSPEAPLLSSLVDGGQALAYRSLYGSMKIWLNKAIDGSDLSWADKVAAARASPHWLRHTCGTRALERGVPLDVVGQLLGHADPRTTARYTRAHLRRVSDELEKAFG